MKKLTLTKKQTQLAKELRNELRKQTAKEFRRSQKTKRRKNARVTKKNQKNKNKKTLLVKRRRKIIHSFAQNKKYVRQSLIINLKKRDQLDLSDFDNQDSGLIYLVLLPYLTALLKRLRKPRETFQIRLHYFDGVSNEIISTRYADYLPTPEAQEDELHELIVKLVSSVVKYLDVLRAEYVLKKLELVVFKDKNDSAISNSKKKRKSKK